MNGSEWVPTVGAVLGTVAIAPRSVLNPNTIATVSLNYCPIEKAIAALSLTAWGTLALGWDIGDRS